MQSKTSLKQFASPIIFGTIRYAALYMNAAKAKKRALAICTVSDHIITGASLDAEARQNSFTEMMEVALNTAVAMDNL